MSQAYIVTKWHAVMPLGHSGVFLRRLTHGISALIPKSPRTSDSVESIFLLEVLPYASAEHEKSEVRPAGIILRLNQSGETYQRIGYFDFEWPNGVWLTLHNSGSRGHDERRRRFEKEAFAGCSMKVVTII